VGQWFGEALKNPLGAEKVLVQKSGYFARSAPANDQDRALIDACCGLAVQEALEGQGQGVVGQDQERGGLLRLVEFDRIRGGKPLDLQLAWVQQLFQEISGTPLSCCG
jgi:pyrophosphate--fructose-6-phosphate 1-phosphotransferase